jgi:hypothetical protein
MFLSMSRNIRKLVRTLDLFLYLLYTVILLSLILLSYGFSAREGAISLIMLYLTASYAIGVIGAACSLTGYIVRRLRNTSSSVLSKCPFGAMAIVVSAGVVHLARLALAYGQLVESVRLSVAMVLFVVAYAALKTGKYLKR